ncbi:MAG: DNA-methyltransferase [Burkholderiales bacterium]
MRQLNLGLASEEQASESMHADHHERLARPEILPRQRHAVVLRGDAFDLFDELPDACVDLIITSPPYWGQRSYDLAHNWELFNDIPKASRLGNASMGYEWYRELGGVLGLEPYPEWYVTHMAEILQKAQRVLKASGSLWLNIGDTYLARWSSIRDSGRQGLADHHRLRRKTPLGGIRQEKQLLLIPARVAIACQERGWILRNDMIWYKPNVTPRPEGDRLKLSHEHFFHFVKKPKLGRPKYYYRPESAEGRKNDVVSVNVEAGEADHTATFPPKLIAPRIQTSSPTNGLVLDPFCGTGRVLQVSVALGRRAIGFEKSGKFYRVARAKIGANGKETG